MGFVTGFLGGLTLTSSILYLTISLHQRNRLEQSLLLRQQSLILKNIIDPLPPPRPTSAREARVSVVETVKDRWNGELVGLVRRVQDTDWNDFRDRAEGSMWDVWRKLRDVGQRVTEQVQDQGVGKVVEGSKREG